MVTTVTPPTVPASSAPHLHPLIGHVRLADVPWAADLPAVSILSFVIGTGVA
jgi:hypothetical protein